ncbi:hypothetical protein WR25_21230 [Diploscapter pachys]|uniref:Uncharacterized protein n=1 Tax=Diploscapter pachys TaxID=2018661 RepID=A0A2A2KB90_9BILA|nr:hypothetical protein WR25_07326 [Diploscapter pachys]PAV89267.1 hypothetical protein WR25_21230 [Diploscapter pachys]
MDFSRVFAAILLIALSIMSEAVFFGENQIQDAYPRGMAKRLRGEPIRFGKRAPREPIRFGKRAGETSSFSGFYPYDY